MAGPVLRQECKCGDMGSSPCPSRVRTPGSGLTLLGGVLELFVPDSPVQLADLEQVGFSCLPAKTSILQQ